MNSGCGYGRCSDDLRATQGQTCANAATTLPLPDRTTAFEDPPEVKAIWTAMRLARRKFFLPDHEQNQSLAGTARTEKKIQPPMRGSGDEDSDHQDEHLPSRITLKWLTF